MSSVADFIGFYSYSSYKDTFPDAGADTEGDCIFYNVVRVGGWIPGVGIVAGAINIYIGFAADNITLPGRVYQVARGIFEIFGFGFLFLIPDVAVSLYRFCKPHIEAPVLPHPSAN